MDTIPHAGGGLSTISGVAAPHGATIWPICLRFVLICLCYILSEKISTLLAAPPPAHTIQAHHLVPTTHAHRARGRQGPNYMPSGSTGRHVIETPKPSRLTNFEFESIEPDFSYGEK